MTRVLYALAGEGSGHSTRSKEIISHLIQRGHEVKVISYDQGYKNLKNVFDVTEIIGMNFVYQNNEFKKIQTVFQNILRVKKLITSYNQVLKLTEKFQHQIMITDFEPLSARVALKKYSFDFN